MSDLDLYSLMLARFDGVRVVRSSSKRVLRAHRAWCPSCQPFGPELLLAAPQEPMLSLSESVGGVIRSRCHAGCYDESWEAPAALAAEMTATAHAFLCARDDDARIALAHKMSVASDKLTAAARAAARSAGGAHE